MARKHTAKLTSFEFEIMDALWELNRASIREIQETLPEKKRPAYTTVQTIIRRLEEKGAVRRVKQIGNAYIFEPVITREAARWRLVDELLGFFGGSTRSLISHLAEAGKLCLEDVQELETMLSAKEAQESSPEEKTFKRISARDSRKA
jgi:BlaI family transcriptional regulator, penicillinase repressor